MPSLGSVELYWGYIGIMEKKMEITIVYQSYMGGILCNGVLQRLVPSAESLHVVSAAGNRCASEPGRQRHAPQKMERDLSAVGFAQLPHDLLCPNLIIHPRSLLNPKP